MGGPESGRLHDSWESTQSSLFPSVGFLTVSRAANPLKLCPYQATYKMKTKRELRDFRHEAFSSINPRHFWLVLTGNFKVWIFVFLLYWNGTKLGDLWHWRCKHEKG